MDSHTNLQGFQAPMSSNQIPLSVQSKLLASITGTSKGSGSKEDGIALDEDPLVPSSDSILSKIPIKLKGKDVSQIRFHSLPSSPSKAQGRSLEYTRVENQKLKDNEAQGETICSSKIDAIAIADAHDEKIMEEGIKGESFNPNFMDLNAGFQVSSSLLPDQTRMMVHGNSASPHVLLQNSLYPVHSSFQVSKTTLIDILPPNVPGEQQISLTSAPAIGPTQHLEDINQNGSPTKFESSPNLAPTNFDQLESNFPPLKRNSKVTTSSTNPQPPTKLGKPNEYSLPSSVGKDKAQGNWASLVKEDPCNMKLTYIKPSLPSNEGKFRIKLPSSVAQKGATNWKNTLVGFFLDKLPFSLVQTCAQRRWESKGLVEVLSNGNGFFFFKFSDMERLSAVLEGGPWYFGGRPVFLKQWRPGLNLSKDGCKQVPIWVHFHNVPLEYWTDVGLSYIASTVGKPLHADKMTSSLKRLSYARICVEIGIEDSSRMLLTLKWMMEP